MGSFIPKTTVIVHFGLDFPEVIDSSSTIKGKNPNKKPKPTSRKELGKGDVEAP
jgi:hypothetical protein